MKSLVAPVLILTIGFAPSALGASSTMSCPAGGIGSNLGDQPVLTVETSSGRTLMACGAREAVHKHEIQIQEFDIYSAKQGSFKKLMTVGALGHYLISKDGHRMRLKELTHFEKRWIPIFERYAECGRFRCSVSHEACAFTRPISPPPTALEHFRRYVSGNLKGQVPGTALLDQLGDLALAGNQEAQKAFLNNGSAPALDGASAEMFNDVQSLLHRLKKHHCGI